MRQYLTCDFKFELGKVKSLTLFSRELVDDRLPEGRNVSWQVFGRHWWLTIIIAVAIKVAVTVTVDLGVVIPDYFFWFYSPVFTVLKILYV